MRLDRDTPEPWSSLGKAPVGAPASRRCRWPLIGYKLTINLPRDCHAELVRLAEERRVTVTEVIRSALAMDRYLWDHRDAELLLRDKSTGEVSHIILLRL